MNGSYADVNGIHLYYEIHGKGQPLVLLHGGLGAIEMFGDMLTALAETHQVIGVDLQAHGRTADIDRPITFDAMADDVAGLIRHLGLKQADVMGYSLGGGVAWQLAIRHPALVRKLVVVSTPIKRSAWLPDVLANMAQMSAATAEMMKPSPIYQLYAAIAPRPQDFPVLVGKVSDLLRKDYDWSKDVAKLVMPVMFVMADADSMSPIHGAEIFDLLGGGKRDADWDGSGATIHRLAVLPGTTHYNSFVSPLLPGMVDAFLGKGPEARGQRAETEHKTND